MGELRKRMGMRYTFRKVEGKSVCVFAILRLLSDSLPARFSPFRDKPAPELLEYFLNLTSLCLAARSHLRSPLSDQIPLLQ